MNNSELSGAASSEDSFMAPQTYVYPSTWDNFPEKPLQNNSLFQGVTGVEGTKLVADYNIQGRWVEGEIEQIDLGLWLLHSSGARPNQWERLRENLQSVAKARHPTSRGSQKITKRSCDIAGSLFLLAVLLPLFILVAILIKLDSPGPVFFRHHRVGKDGKRFVLWKFRSMRTDVPKYEVSPHSVRDVRLTRIGRLIRRMSIDEMPQLINVLKGDMSIVGPRPEMPFIVDRYHPVGCERLIAKPGITGLWQISPARAFPIHENLQYDLHYIRNQNFILDCTIILRTITAVIHGIGAV